MTRIVKTSSESCTHLRHPVESLDDGRYILCIHSLMFLIPLIPVHLPLLMAICKSTNHCEWTYLVLYHSGCSVSKFEQQIHNVDDSHWARTHHVQSKLFLGLKKNI